MATVFKIGVLLLVVLGFVAAITTASAQCVEATLPVVDKGRYDFNAAANTARYTCKIGYERGPRGNSNILCVNNQWTWRGDEGPISCRKVSCGTPPEIENAHYLEKSFKFGDEVTYNCDEGYEQDQGVKGNNNIQCQPNRRWTVIRYTCKPVSCPPLANPANGSVVIISGTTGKYEYKFIYRFTCEKEYQSNNRETVDVTCKADGKWSEENIICEERACQFPPEPKANMYIVGTVPPKSKYSDVLEYKCHAWATMSTAPDRPSFSVYCQKDGNWSSIESEYFCVLKTPKCTQAPTIANATPTKVVAEYGNTEVVSYTCNTDYAGNVTATCGGSTWQENGKCEIAACRALPHSDMTNSILLEESKNITCDVGYTANGTKANVKCVGGKLLLANGGAEFKCSAVNCGDPPVIANAHYTKTGAEQFLQVGGGVTYVCNTGYKSDDTSGTTKHISCQSDTTWSSLPVPLNCIIVTCPKVVAPQQGKVTKVSGGAKYEYGDEYRYECDAGYAIDGDKQVEVTCLGTGKWSIENVTCESADCAKPTVPPNSQLTTNDNKWVAGSKRVYTCDAGATVEGSSGGASITLQCQSGGTWTPAGAKCVPTAVTTSQPLTTPSTSTSGATKTLVVVASHLLLASSAILFVHC